jgi:hypothetical protein
MSPKRNFGDCPEWHEVKELSPERAEQHSPGCNPGIRRDELKTALKGRHRMMLQLSSEIHFIIQNPFGTFARSYLRAIRDCPRNSRDKGEIFDVRHEIPR